MKNIKKVFRKILGGTKIYLKIKKEYGIPDPAYIPPPPLSRKPKTQEYEPDIVMKY